MSKQTTNIKTACYHCGEDCSTGAVVVNEKTFCCTGCKMVFEIISQSDLCDYYSIAKNPGSAQKASIREGKFAFLDDEKISRSLVTFAGPQQTHVTFYLP